MKKFLLMLILIIMLCSTSCIASSTENWSQKWDFKPGLFLRNGLEGSFSNTISQYINSNDSTIGKIMGYFSIILVIARILCLAVMLLMGIRYMIAGPEKRADLKARSIALLVGLVVIFGASYIMSIAIRFIDSMM